MGLTRGEVARTFLMDELRCRGHQLPVRSSLSSLGRIPTDSPFFPVQQRANNMRIMHPSRGGHYREGQLAVGVHFNTGLQPEVGTGCPSGSAASWDHTSCPLSRFLVELGASTMFPRLTLGILDIRCSPQPSRTWLLATRPSPASGRTLRLSFRPPLVPSPGRCSRVAESPGNRRALRLSQGPTGRTRAAESESAVFAPDPLPDGPHLFQ